MHVRDVLSNVSVPSSGRCIKQLQTGEVILASKDELMIEFELCIGVIFKPLRHHLPSLTSESAAPDDLATVWKSVLVVLDMLLNSKSASSPEGKQAIPRDLQSNLDNLVSEHLRNAIMVLISAGALLPDSETKYDVTSMTVEAVSQMGINETSLREWKKIAMSLNQ